MPLSADEREFAELLVDWGHLSHQELEEVMQLHESEARGGSAPPFPDTLIKYGFLTPRQVADARNADVKGIFVCSECGANFEARVGAGRRNRACPRCQTTLTRQGDPTASSPAKLVSHAVPVDVQVAMHTPEARFGKYVLLGEVGRGGLAVVRRAWDREERCYVALKFLQSPNADANRVEDLIQEGERAVRLRHPNIIRTYELGRVGTQYYLAMEYLEGHTLADLLKSARGRSKVSPFYDDPARYLSLLRDVARALHYAHTRVPPLVHCDLKPSNIFVELSWRPYVFDFGVAQEINPAGDRTERGEVRGSPAYMAPEQVLGRPGEIDVRTDVYGIGAVLYDLLTGRPPLTGTLQEVLDKNLLLVGVPPPAEILKVRAEISEGNARDCCVPPEIEAICMKCLAKEKADRYATAKDVADALAQALQARLVTQAKQSDSTNRIREEVVVPRPAVVSRPRSRTLRNGVATLFVVGLVGAGAVLALQWKRAVVEDTSPRGRFLALFEDCVAHVQVERAEMLCQEFEAKHPESGFQAWLEGRRDELQMVQELRCALGAHLAQATPQISTIKVARHEWTHVRILAASERGVAFSADGESRREALWEDVDAASLVKLARLNTTLPPRPRLILAYYAILNDLYGEGEEILQSLKGSALAAKGKELEEMLTVRRQSAR